MKRQWKKGQNIVVEEVLVFGIGLVLALGLFTTFQTFGNQAQTSVAREKLSTIASYVRATIMQATQIHGSGKVFMSVPHELSGSSYLIDLNTSQLAVVSADGHSHAMQLHGVESTYALQGQAHSEADRIFVEKNGQNITIGSE